MRAERDRLTRARLLVAVVQLGPGLALLGFVAAYPPRVLDPTWRLALLAPPVLIVVSSVIYLWRQGNRPAVWQNGTSLFGLATGVALGATIGLHDRSLGTGIVTAVILGLLVAFFCTAGAVTARRIAETPADAANAKPKRPAELTARLNETLTKQETVGVRFDLRRFAKDLMADYRTAPAGDTAARAALEEFRDTTLARFRTGTSVNAVDSGVAKLRKTAVKLDDEIRDLLTSGTHR